MASRSESLRLPDFAGFACADALGEEAGLPETRQTPEIVPEVRLVLVADVLGAPATGEQPEDAPVVPNPAGAIDDVRGEEAAPEIGSVAQNPIHPTEGPERLAVAVPLPVVLLVYAAEEAIE